MDIRSGTQEKRPYKTEVVDLEWGLKMINVGLFNNFNPILYILLHDITKQIQNLLITTKI
jgi:hypothetical protein